MEPIPKHYFWMSPMKAPYPFETAERRERVARFLARFCPALVSWGDLEEVLTPKRKYAYIFLGGSSAPVAQVFDGWDYPEAVD